MNINKSNVIKYWYLSLPAFVIAVAGLYCLGFHFGQWLYTANHWCILSWKSHEMNWAWKSSLTALVLVTNQMYVECFSCPIASCKTVAQKKQSGQLFFVQNTRLMDRFQEFFHQICLQRPGKIYHQSKYLWGKIRSIHFSQWTCKRQGGNR